MSAPIHPALKRFLWDIQSMVELTDDPREILLVGSDLMARLLAEESWLPDAFAAAAADGPRQYQLYNDVDARFCVVSTVLRPGEALPVFKDPHWQLVGVVRGAADLQKMLLADDGAAQAAAPGRRLGPGAVERLAPKAGEAVALSGAGGEDGATVLIHVHGREIGPCPRYTVTPEGRLEARAFAYANAPDAPAHDIWSIQTRIED